jgi:hypothetical protein
MRRSIYSAFLLLTVVCVSASTFAQSRVSSLNCDDPYSLCTERQYNRSYDPEYTGHYIGHDEPSLLFYSNVPGSGNNNVYEMILPKDPATFPTDANSAGTGGPTVWNFQLHPAFWMGMAICDSQSFPLYTHRCTPDSDSNIFDDPNPKSKKYMGRHPGTAFLELQFYPPGWVNGYSQTQYAVAMNIDSYNLKPLGPTGPILNNAACLNSIGVETVNFGLLTLDGKSQAPGDPQNGDPAKNAVIPGETLLMNPGDRLIVSIQDTPAGLRTTVRDATTGQTGWMTASVANGFANILFAPNATTCTSIPYAFHPMYATTSEHTNVPWAAHTYNVAFSDEIGHYNYCDVQDNSIFSGLGACLSSPVENEVDPTTGAHNEADDLFCVDTASSVLFGSIAPLGGCLDSDVDFDGVPYHHAWPGSGKDPWGFSAVPTPVRFTSPRFRASGGEGEDDLRSYSRVAFEADLAAIEDSSVCNNLTGVGCVNPPPGALFYPIYTTTHRDEGCWWQIGGASIPGTTNKFGGSSATEFKTLFGQVAIDGTSSHPSSILVYENFHQILPNNPCR